MGRLEGKVAIVTGGTGGIGRAAAERFVAEGAKVLIVDLDETLLAEAAAPLGDACAWHVADVTDPQATKDYVTAAVERFGGLDVLVANAGIEGKVGPITEQSVDSFDAVMAVNVRGVWLGVREAFPHLERRGGGSIVITSSVAGVGGAANLSPYITSKHATIGLMRSAALEGAPARIRVNTVNPSPVETRMMRSLEDGLMPGDGQTAHAALAASIPLGRYAEPAEIANLMLFLASDEAKFLTGGVYMADGGMTAD